MDKFVLEEDIPILYVTATSFPAGIMKAHRKVYSLVSSSKERRYFGVSRPENGGEIVYRAAAEELEEGEAAKLGCESMFIPKGNYISIEIDNYVKDVPIIDRTFRKLLTHPDLDPNGYCVEWYLNEKDVRCMVKLHP
ncbi:transcriptional regulator [Leptospira idonii]|uniref:Transcriptional regulator n=1 Tax=Leptospira idonii TaxID=1193500 RepID=A0A4R9LXU1_9LEPT|nr:transcriptional regulator [Leptospira idonii]TGN19154.1 transcriptional regulator [Leptospira idonii]